MTVPPPEGQPSADTHAQTLSDAVDMAYDPPSEAHAALDSLLSLVATLTEERDAWRTEAGNAQAVAAVALDERDAAMREAATLREALNSPSTVAQMFHEAYERLAPAFGYKTREASAVPWNDVPAENKGLMVAVAGEVLAALAAAAAPTDEPA